MNTKMDPDSYNYILTCKIITNRTWNIMHLASALHHLCCHSNCFPSPAIIMLRQNNGMLIEMHSFQVKNQNAARIDR